MKIKGSYFLLFFFFLNTAFSQYSDKIKLYTEKLNSATEDTAKIFYWNQLSFLLDRSDFKTAYEYAAKALELSEKINYLRGKIHSLNNIGNAYWYNNNYVKAQSYYFKAYKINDSIGDKRGIAESLYNIGWIICMQQKNQKEIGYLYRSLKAYEELNDSKGVAPLLNTLGQFYSELYMTTKLRENFDSSLSYYNKAIDYVKKNKSTSNGGEAKYYGSLGDLLAISGDYNSAKFYKEKSLDYYLRLEDSARYINNLDDYAYFEFKLGNVDKAIEICEKCYHYAVRNRASDILMPACHHLDEFYAAKGNIKKAYDFFKMYVALKDTMDTELFSSNLNEIQNGFEIEKREVSIKELKQSNEIHSLKEDRNKFLLIGAIVVLLIIIFIAYLLYRQNQQKNIVNVKLQEQNNIISEKKKEIDHSINYAKGIQNAVLPDIKELKKHVPESFIFYLPKDVVSGDFYCFHELEEYFYCIAADCTGHGVPGALMSIVSMDKINQAIYEKRLTEPADILKFLNVEIKKALKQHNDESKQKDGLDISILRFSKTKKTVVFAGANRPLFIIRDGILTEYKSDKVAIAGFTADDYQFKQQKIDLHKEDCLYIFTDGYADQFGGPEGKKFMTKNFKSMVQSLSTKPMSDQETEITKSHSDWKGNYEQVDDILVIGLKM